MKNNLPERKPTRLKNFDYHNNGYYFITICTHNRKKLLSKIVGQGLAPAEIQLSNYGKIAKAELLELENRYDCVKIDKYVIMPDHIHVIVVMRNSSAGASPCPTLSDVVCAFKSITTRKCNLMQPKQKIFQTSFYDHIIRNESDYIEVWEYIENNPCNFTENSR